MSYYTQGDRLKDSYRVLTKKDVMRPENWPSESNFPYYEPREDTNKTDMELIEENRAIMPPPMIDPQIKEKSTETHYDPDYISQDPKELSYEDSDDPSMRDDNIDSEVLDQEPYYPAASNFKSYFNVTEKNKRDLSGLGDVPASGVNWPMNLGTAALIGLGAWLIYKLFKK